MVYLLIHFHCNLGYVFLSFDLIKTIIIIIILFCLQTALDRHMIRKLYSCSFKYF